ncbi:MAG TPA: DNA polymerase III subunit gamma/tau [Methylomirabilota bacterium]|nr:DNA polymerase III subunit gamma/tau [Methylomirabilota bacterium]
MVYYRKYRPQIIDDLDNAAVRELLSAVLKKDATHAFLFTGPKGLGKTSAARIIAKVVNCTTSEKKRTNGFEPCNTCEHCVSITNGTNMDVLEIDAASNRGIDEIRELKEKIRLSPLSVKKKVYIIDEVHMLTTEAFNALLKTLEEPPSHAMFILCTTEPHKIPSTILSRCFHINFNLATDEEIVRSLKRVATGEQLEIADNALVEIAKMADGGFRDAAKLLEELVALSDGKKITKELIETKYKLTSSSNLVEALVKSLHKKDVVASLEIVKKTTEQGIDMKFFLQQLIEALHSLLLVRITANGQPASSDFTLEEIKEIVSFLTKAYVDMKYAVLPQLPLELAIIEYTTQNVISSKVETGSVEMTQQGVTVSSLRKQVGAMKKKEALYGEAKAAKEEKITVETTSVELMKASPNDEITKEWLDSLWKNIIAEMKQYNHTIAGLLRGCVIKSYDKKRLIIQTNYKFHKERLDDMKTREALSKVSKMLTGNEVAIEVELKSP